MSFLSLPDSFARLFFSFCLLARMAITNTYYLQNPLLVLAAHYIHLLFLASTFSFLAGGTCFFADTIIITFISCGSTAHVIPTQKVALAVITFE